MNMDADANLFILYIEDERPMLELVRHALKLAGYDVTGVTSGQQGLGIMRERKPDLLLLDLMMPGINGWDVYREVKADPELSDIPVIVITARVPERGLTIVDDLPPVDDYITKPFDVEQLIFAVQKLVKRS
jgi:two-component system, OmpR family, alkaline phosphatase synthesis response regulator PhoP